MERLHQYQCQSQGCIFYYQSDGFPWAADGPLVAHCPVCGGRRPKPTGRTYDAVDAMKPFDAPEGEGRADEDARRGEEPACLSCGTALPAGATECPECGFPFSRKHRSLNKDGNAARAAARLAKWRGRLQDEYAGYEEWCRYADTYGLAARLGFPSNRAAWDANPTVEGSTNPADYRAVPERKPKPATPKPAGKRPGGWPPGTLSPKPPRG
jgi:hypothetical protein